MSSKQVVLLYPPAQYWELFSYCWSVKFELSNKIQPQSPKIQVQKLKVPFPFKGSLILSLFLFPFFFHIVNPHNIVHI